jgi:hypothetical protein
MVDLSTIEIEGLFLLVAYLWASGLLKPIGCGLSIVLDILIKWTGVEPKTRLPKAEKVVQQASLEIKVENGAVIYRVDFPRMNHLTRPSGTST